MKSSIIFLAHSCNNMHVNIARIMHATATRLRNNRAARSNIQATCCWWWRCCGLVAVVLAVTSVVVVVVGVAVIVVLVAVAVVARVVIVVSVVVLVVAVLWLSGLLVVVSCCRGQCCSCGSGWLTWLMRPRWLMCLTWPM